MTDPGWHKEALVQIPALKLKPRICFLTQGTFCSSGPIKIIDNTLDPPTSAVTMRDFRNIKGVLMLGICWQMQCCHYVCEDFDPKKSTTKDDSAIKRALYRGLVIQPFESISHSFVLELLFMFSHWIISVVVFMLSILNRIKATLWKGHAAFCSIVEASNSTNEA